MTMLEYLRQGSLLEQRIIYLTRKLDDLKASRYSISGTKLQGDRVQTSRDGTARFARTLEQIEEMEERIGREIERLNALREQIEETIHQLLKMEYQLVLTYRYLDNMSWEEIGQLLHAGRSTLGRWHEKAISLLEMPDNPIIIQKSGHFGT